VGVYEIIKFLALHFLRTVVLIRLLLGIADFSDRRGCFLNNFQQVIGQVTRLALTTGQVQVLGVGRLGLWRMFVRGGGHGLVEVARELGLGLWLVRLDDMLGCRVVYVELMRGIFDRDVSLFDKLDQLFLLFVCDGDITPFLFEIGGFEP